MTFVHRL